MEKAEVRIAARFEVAIVRGRAPDRGHFPGAGILRPGRSVIDVGEVLVSVQVSLRFLPFPGS